MRASHRRPPVSRAGPRACTPPRHDLVDGTHRPLRSSSQPSRSRVSSKPRGRAEGGGTQLMMVARVVLVLTPSWPSSISCGAPDDSLGPERLRDPAICLIGFSCALRRRPQAQSSTRGWPARSRTPDRSATHVQSQRSVPIGVEYPLDGGPGPHAELPKQTVARMGRPSAHNRLKQIAVTMNVALYTRAAVRSPSRRSTRQRATSETRHERDAHQTEVRCTGGHGHRTVPPA